MMPAPKQSWTSKSTSETKPWGETQTWSTIHSFYGKRILIRKGERTSLKFHKLKNETFFVLEGVAQVTLGSSRTLANPSKYPYEQKIICAGEVLTVQSECPYRIAAIDDCVIIEIGDKANDTPVILEDDYGRAGPV